MAIVAKKINRKKRSREGSYAWKKGNLYARLQFTDSNGKYREKTRRVESNKVSDVWAIVRAMKDELQNHGEDSLNTDKMTFKELSDEYQKLHVFPAVMRNGIKISGLKSARSQKINLNVLDAFFGQKKIRSIKPLDIEKFKKERLDTPTVHGKERAIATVNRELATLRAILNFAFRHDWIIVNPIIKTTKLISVAGEKERERILSFDEEKRLLSVCINERFHLKPIVICALDTAMRPDEIFKLVWSDVDFQSKTIAIRESISKTEKARIIGLTERLNVELENLWNVSPKDKSFSVFGLSSIKTAWRTACRLSDISGCRFRDLRHTATSRMVQSGIPHAEIMKATGHTQLKTFLRYVNLTKESAGESANKLSNYLQEKITVNEIDSDFVN